MFPFWINACCSSSQKSHKEAKAQQLTFLKWIRDGLEARLAAVEAAIATIERQMQDTAPSQEES